ncbi:MAG TPA: nuclear transport factor 2 family protein [Gammaproteobacteria bacterium]|nr:nuclear transport factor 2 family protein [Gammaproteobacteria bacterium]
MTRPPFRTATEAERAFYQAFAYADADAMIAVWADDEAVTCVHPMAPPLVGREAVDASWRSILEASVGVDIRVEVLRQNLWPDLVVHLVQEHIRLPDGDRRNPPLITTNIYQRSRDSWHMVLHHASPTGRGQAAPRDPGSLH